MRFDPVLQAVAAHGLPGVRSAPIEAPLATGAWDGFLLMVRRQRLIGLLAAMIESGVFPVTVSQREEAAELHLLTCASAVHLDRHLLLALAEFERCGIDVVVLKGTASAHLNYPDPALRAYGDNDLLFRSEQFTQALEVVRQLGYERVVAPPRPSFDRRFSKGATLKRPDGDELDMHRNLVFGSFGFAIDLDELFASTSTFRLADREVHALGSETRLLHACYHAALGDPDPRLSSVRDVAQMVSFGRHDPSRVVELARRWRATAVLARAFRLCRVHLGVELEDPLVQVVDGYEPTAVERRAIASYVGDNRHYAAKVAASLPFLPGIGAKLAFLGSATFPTSEFAARRGDQSRIAWLRRGVGSLFHGYGEH